MLRNAHPKPDKLEQSKVPGAKLVPFSDEIYAKQADRPLLAVDPRGMTKEEADRYMRNTYYQRWFGFIQLHALVLVRPGDAAAAAALSCGARASTHSSS